MWTIIFETYEHRYTALCVLPKQEDRPATSLGILNHDNRLIQFILVAGAELNDLVYDRIRSRSQDAGLTNVEFLDSDEFTLTFQVRITEESLSLNICIEVLEESLPSFKEITAKLPGFIEVDRSIAQRSLQLKQQMFNRNFNERSENTMDPLVLLSARQSELRLRANYNFPAPMYAMDFGDNDPLEHHALFANVAPPPPPSPLRSLDDFDEVEEDLDDVSEHDSDEPAALPIIPIPPSFALMYEPEENTAIEAFQQYLYSKRDSLFVAGHLVKDGASYVLSADLELALQAATHGVMQPSLALARSCLDLLATIRALQATGSHSDNTDMKYTHIFGYGLRNIVALLWHCAVQARDAIPARFVYMVTFEDAVNALITGIADGARGKNRNEDTGVDDLDIDHRYCDQGRYNCLIAAFVGIFPEVQIKYSTMEILSDYLKREIYEFILDEFSEYFEAVIFINTWSQSVAAVDPSYTTIIAKLNSNEEKYILKFLNETCAEDPDLRSKIKDQIENIKQQMQTAAFGYSLLEQVTLTVAEFNLAWKKRHGTSPDASHEAVVATDEGGHAVKRLTM